MDSSFGLFQLDCCSASTSGMTKKTPTLAKVRVNLKRKQSFGEEDPVLPDPSEVIIAI